MSDHRVAALERTSPSGPMADATRPEPLASPMIDRS